MNEVLTRRLLRALALVLALAAAPAWALDCGEYEFPNCKGPERQYAGGFNGRTGYGGFGGGDCTAQRTPVIFIHGNADRAIGWDSPPGAVAGFQPPANSVYDTLRAHGYKDCELFGITYLTKAERESPQGNYHRPDKYRIIGRFIEAVKAYTGKSQVDIVAHSLGVSMALASLTWHDASGKPGAGWGSVRRFVNIAGGIRGLSSCLYTGPANPVAATCGSENVLDRWVFGFYPDTGWSWYGFNAWTAADGPFSLREMPDHHRDVKFYTIHAGEHDEVHCTVLVGMADCGKGALFEANPNVMAQLDVGVGSTATQFDFDLADKSPFKAMGGDVDGVGHFRARNNSGEIIWQMLDSGCIDLACATAYKSGPVRAD